MRDFAVHPDSGLTASKASCRIGRHGRNELQQRAEVQPLQIIVEQILNAMTLVLLFALAASSGLQAWIKGGILRGIVLLNISLGFL